MIQKFAVTVVALVSLVSAGCRTQQAGQEAAGWPEQLNDFTIVWTAADGVDLVTGPAVPVRAYIESFVLWELTGDDKYLYPGFADAVDEALRPGGRPADSEWVGTLTNHLVSIDDSGGEVRAIGCMFTYTAASPHGDEYEAHGVLAGSPEAGITAFEVRLTAPEQSTLPAGPQQGPERAPFDDVFGGYRVTGYFGGYFGPPGPSPLWQDYQQATEQCIAAAPDPRERRSYLLQNYVPRAEFFTRPPSPGWPAKPTS